MPAVFYARIADKVYGPFDGDKLKKLAAAGKITRNDALSKDGKTGWTPAGNVRGLFPESSAPAIPAPATQATSRPPAIVKPELLEPERSDDLIVYTAQATRDMAVSAAKSTGELSAKGATFLARATVAAVRVVGEFTASPAPLETTPIPVAPADPTATRPCPFCAEPVLIAAKKCKHCGEIIDPALRAAVTPTHAVQAPAITITNVNTNVLGGVKPHNTCATLAAGLGLLSFIAAFVPILGLIVLPAAGLTLLIALFGLIIALGRGGTGLVGSLGGGLLAVIAIPIALFSTAAGVGGAIHAVGNSRPPAVEATEPLPGGQESNEPAPM